MEQTTLGINQQVFVGLSGEVFSANFTSYFTEFTHRIFLETMSPTGIVFLRSSFYPANVSAFIKDCLRHNESANILLLSHALPKSLDFLNQKAVFFLDESTKDTRGVYLANDVIRNMDFDVAFPAIMNEQWLYENLKNYLVLNKLIQFSSEEVDVIL